MPVLSNAKHEAFAKGLLEGLNAEDAYAKAGYKPHRGNASTLRTNQNILDRLVELQQRAAEKAEWTAADRLKMLSEIAQRTAGEDPRVAVSAIAEANKMQGSHAPAKAELTGKDGAAIQSETVHKLDQSSIDLIRSLVE